MKIFNEIKFLKEITCSFKENIAFGFLFPLNALSINQIKIRLRLSKSEENMAHSKAKTSRSTFVMSILRIEISYKCSKNISCC